MIYFIKIYGCQMNYSDAERLASVLEFAGLKKTEDETKADILCAIACSVRQSAVDRLYALGKKWQTWKNQKSKIKNQKSK